LIIIDGQFIPDKLYTEHMYLFLNVHLYSLETASFLNC